MWNKSVLPDIFAVTFKVEDGHKLSDVSRVLQVIDGIVQISLPLLIKVDQSRGTCNNKPLLHQTVHRIHVLVFKMNTSGAKAC